MPRGIELPILEHSTCCGLLPPKKLRENQILIPAALITVYLVVTSNAIEIVTFSMHAKAQKEDRKHCCNIGLN